MNALRHSPLPGDDPAVLDDSSVVSDVGSISEHNLNAVAIQVEDGSIEVPILVTSGRRRAIRSTSGIQSGGVEFSDGRSTGSGEGNVRCAGFYAMICQLNMFLANDGILTQAFLGTRRSRHRGYLSQFGCLVGRYSGIQGVAEQREKKMQKLVDARQ